MQNTQSANNTKQVCIITGANKRIGGEIALKMAGLHYNLLLTYNKNKEDAVCVAENAKSLGVQCAVRKLDLNLQNDYTEVVNEASQMGKLMVLVNNASVFEEDLAKNTCYEGLLQNFNIHLFAPILLSQAFFNGCLGQKESVGAVGVAGAAHAETPSIINITDSNVVRNSSKYFSYLLSKKSLHNATALMAAEFAPHVRVNAIAPGYIATPSNVEDEELYQKERTSCIPMKTIGAKIDISNCVEFLVNSPFISGETIFVDGGQKLLSGWQYV